MNALNLKPVPMTWEETLDGPFQDAAMEAAYLTQVHVRAANEAAPGDTVGFSNPRLPNTIFAQNDVRVASLSDEELRKAEEMCSPEFQPRLWGQWRERLNNWAGGIDTYREIYDTVRQHDIALAENVEPRRWWKG